LGAADNAVIINNNYHS